MNYLPRLWMALALSSLIALFSFMPTTSAHGSQAITTDQVDSHETDLKSSSEKETAKSTLSAVQQKAESAETSEPKFTLEDLKRWFQATDVELLDDGRVKLRYNFETMQESLLVDFSPDIKKTKGKVRWSRHGEGGSRYIEKGLIIANNGALLHKARWEEAVMQVDFLSLCGHRNGNILAAIYAYGKKQGNIVASNQGRQCLKLSRRMRHTRPPIPRKEPRSLAADRRLSFGFRIRDGVFTAETGEVRTADTSADPKFLKGIEPGHVGLAWKGQVQGYVFMIDVEGKLDPEWIRQQLENEKK